MARRRSRQAQPLHRLRTGTPDSPYGRGLTACPQRQKGPDNGPDLPIPAEQPLDATRKAAGQVVTLACAEAVAVQAAASITLAALLWPLIPAAHAMADLASALDQWRPLCPLPEQDVSAPAKVVVVTPGSGGAGRGATVPSRRPGAVRAAAAITLGVEEEFVLLDPSTGATVLAAPDLVRMLGGEPGIQQELMRFQVETGTTVCTGLDDLGRELLRLRRLAAAAAASLGCRLVASGVAPYRTPGLAACHRPAPLPKLPAARARGGQRRHLRLPRARLGPLPGGGRPGAGAAAALAGAAARGHRQLPDRRGAIPDGPAAVCAPGPLADRAPARGVAGPGRRHTAVPRLIGPGRAGRAERLLPRPAVPAPPTVQSPSPTSASTPAGRRCCREAPPRRHRPGRGPPRHAGGSRDKPAGRRGAGRQRPGTGSPGQQPTRYQLGRLLGRAGASLPPARSGLHPVFGDHGDTETITTLLRQLDQRAL